MPGRPGPRATEGSTAGHVADIVATLYQSAEARCDVRKLRTFAEPRRIGRRLGSL